MKIHTKTSTGNVLLVCSIISVSCHAHTGIDTWRTDIICTIQKQKFNVTAWSQGRSDKIPHVSEGTFSMEVIALQNSSSDGHCVELQDGQKTKAKGWRHTGLDSCLPGAVAQHHRHGNSFLLRCRLWQSLVWICKICGKQTFSYKLCPQFSGLHTCFLKCTN